jgi:hypothetical protein
MGLIVVVAPDDLIACLDVGRLIEFEDSGARGTPARIRVDVDSPGEWHRTTPPFLRERADNRRRTPGLGGLLRKPMTN